MRNLFRFVVPVYTQSGRVVMLMMMGMDASVDVKAGRVNAAKLQ